MAIYYVRQDGTATNKTAATSSDSAATSMNRFVFNAETFAAGDEVIFSNKGGTFIPGPNVVPPSGGALGNEITYKGEEDYLPVIDGRSFDVQVSNVIIRDITVQNAITTNFNFAGANSNIVTHNLVAINSGNQCFQHLDTVSVVHNNIYAARADDEGVSLHDNTTVTINGGTVELNTTGFNFVGTPTLTVNDVTIRLNTVQTVENDQSGGTFTWRRCYFEENNTAVRVMDCLNGDWFYEFNIFKNLTSADFYLLFRTGVVNSHVLNCVFYGNGAACTAIFNLNTNSIFKNNIFIDCNDSFFGNNGTIENNCFSNAGTARGSSHVTTDPLFVDAPNNYRLQNGSPCIGTGADVSVLLTEAIDLYGETVPYATGWNIGAGASQGGGGLTGSTILNLVYDAGNAALRTVVSAITLLTDAVHGEVASANVCQIGSEAKDFDGAALPNSVDEGDAVRLAATQFGVTYTFPVNEDGSLSPVNASGYFDVEIQSVSGTANLAQETGGNLDTLASIITNDDSNPGATPPIALVGGEYRNIDSTYTDGDATILQTDLAGKLKIAGYDGALDVVKVQEQSPLPSNREDVAQLVSGSDIGASDGVWVDQGSAIPTAGFTRFGLWCDFTANDSTGNQIRVLVRHTQGGVNYVQEALSSYQKTLGDADTNVFYEFQISNLVKELRVQTRALDVDTGGGTEATITIDYTKGWA